MAGSRNLFIKGTLWTGLGKYSQYFTQLVTTIFLARLLEPVAFGTIAVVVSINGFVSILTESGMAETIIQKKNIKGGALSSLFFFSVLIGALFMCILILLSPLIETFFNFSDLSELINVTSVSLLLTGITAIPEGILRRNLNFRKISYIEIFSSFASSIVAISMAFLGLGVWALVWQMVTRSFIRMVMMFNSSKWLPIWRFEFNVLKDSLSFSSYVLGFNGINYWARNADNLLIGKILGEGALGFYSQAYKLMMIPYQGITGVINPTLHPIFSSFQSDFARIRQAYLRILVPLASLSAVLGSFMFSWSEEIITFLFGEKWSDSILTFAYLSLVSIIQPITATTGPVLLACNKPDLYFKLGIFSSLVFVLGFALSVEFGYEIVALGYVATNLIVSPIMFFWTYSKQLKGSFSDVLFLYVRIALIFASFWCISAGLKQFLPNIGDFLSLVFAGGLILIFCIILFYYQLTDLWINRRPKE